MQQATAMANWDNPVQNDRPILSPREAADNDQHGKNMRHLVELTPMEDPDVRVVAQSLSIGPLGRVKRAAFFNNSRGIRTPSMRVLGSYAAVYLLSGRGRYIDQRGTDRPVSAGDLILLFPDLPHRYGPPDEERWSEFYVMFEGPVFDLWRDQQLLNPQDPVHRLEPVSYWLKRLESAVATPRKTLGGDGDPLAGVCRLQLVLADVLTHITERRMGSDDRDWLERAYAALDESAASGESLDWDAFCGQFGMSYENFRKKFARLAEIPPARYRMRRVMERASELMHQSRLPLKEIAARCGFCNEFHFSRRFKQLVGLSPRDFRRQLPR